MSYIPELYDFFTQLSQNNDRQWFAANRDRYQRLRELWLADIDRLISAMAEWDPQLASLTARSCAYRFNRDTRFSLDKSPYKTFFSAAISPWGKKSMHAGYYIEIGIPTSYVRDSTAECGVFDSPALKKLRHAIVDNI